MDEYFNAYYDVGFRISGKKMSPHDITDLLGITPDSYKISAEPPNMTDGKIDDFCVSEVGTWIISSSSPRETPIHKQIEEMLPILRSLKEKLLRLKKSGMELCFYCGYFVDDVMGGLDLPSHILDELGRLGIDFSLCFYGALKHVRTETCDINDKRWHGQDEIFANAKLHYHDFPQNKEHQHCEFCYILFSSLETDINKGAVKEGYSTLDNEWWVCEKCFNDFDHMMTWTVVKSPS